ncbi:uncharacterized protein LOC114357207 [Ostrinia furnacalis]|uniref:uncharacterized protein LOC114357207 n=1 Tax=Ostrinia furnacalis TaxID=93504 RepID=UPI00103B45F3|nr:uncharacterized protein LOC114357207 [Ostrinia furnacalis]
MGTEAISNPGYSGGLEELYTDFDAWITKRSWKYRQRPSRSPQCFSSEKPPSAATIDFQECLVNGFDRRVLNTFPKDLIGLLNVCRNVDLVHFDLAMVRLVRENGRRRILFVNRSKL